MMWSMYVGKRVLRTLSACTTRVVAVTSRRLHAYLSIIIAYPLSPVIEYNAIRCSAAVIRIKTIDYRQQWRYQDPGGRYVGVLGPQLVKK